METEADLSIPPEPDISNIQISPMTIELVVILIVILLLLVLSALISGSEVAYFSLNPNDLHKLRKSKKKSCKKILENLEKPENLLATILVSNNIVNIAMIILSTYFTSNIIHFIQKPVLEFILQIVVITFFLLLFGEIIPKVYAAHYNLAFARFISLPLQLLSFILKPINNILIFSSSIVNKKLSKYKKNISMDEISQALDLTSDKELAEEKEILEGIVKFGDKSVVEIMKPRVDVVAIDINTSFKEVLSIIKDSGYSRIPVYSESFDHVNGILYIKDLLIHAHKGNTFKWQTTIRPPFYVPETKKINNLLEDFRKRKVHLAIVVDEYGGSSGIVTLEDILEEIVGEITDEFDEEEKLFTKLSDESLMCSGKILLTDFYKIINCDENIFDEIKGDAETLAGLILEIKGNIPELHEEIIFKQYQFRIESVNNRRIEKIKVTIQ